MSISISGNRFANADQHGKLRRFDGPAKAQAGERIFHNAKGRRRPAVYRDDFFEQSSIKRYGLEDEHSYVSQTGHQGIVAAMKQWHQQPRLILKRKPIAVGASHSEDIAHSTFLVVARAPAG